jgi:hypothetical protein
MEFTETRVFGLRNGVAVASGWKLSGKGADRENRQMVTEWVRKGLDIITLHKDDPLCAFHHQQMFADLSDQQP